MTQTQEIQAKPKRQDQSATSTKLINHENPKKKSDQKNLSILG